MSKNANPNDIYPPNPEDSYFCSEAEFQHWYRGYQIQERWQDVLARAFTMEVATAFENEFLTKKSLLLASPLDVPDVLDVCHRLDLAQPMAAMPPLSNFRF